MKIDLAYFVVCLIATAGIGFVLGWAVTAKLGRWRWGWRRRWWW